MAVTPVACYPLIAKYETKFRLWGGVMKSILMAAIVVTGLAVSSNNSAAQSSDIVLQRLERLENENAALRDRVRRLEGARNSMAVKPAGKSHLEEPIAYKAAQRIAPAAAVDPVANWTGLYVGASAGWGSLRSSHTGSIVSNPGGDPFIGVGGQTTMPLTGSGKGDGAMADFRGGYNVRIAPQILTGLQLEGTLSQISANQSAHIGPCSLFCTATFDRSDVGTVRIDWMASLLGRLGGVYGDNYIYGIGGWSFARLRSPLLTQMWAGNHADFGVAEKTFSSDGPTIGVGWERKLDRNWSANAEYRYTRFSGVQVGTSSAVQNAFFGTSVSASSYQFSNDLHALKIGVNYRPDLSITSGW